MFFSRNNLVGYTFLTFLYIAFGAAPIGAASPENSPAQVTVSADSVFVLMATAWEAHDEKAMAAIVHRDGLRITHGGDYDRFTSYSPDQAFYYFQDLFQGNETTVFKFQRLPDPPDGKRSMGMVGWEYQRPDRKFPVVMKFVVVLFKQDGLWRLAELNSISQG